MATVSGGEGLVGPGKGIIRDRWGRAMIVPPQPLGAKAVPYTRATTVAKTLEDQSGLMTWKQRMTLLGLVARRDLLTAAAATDPTDKQTLNRLAEQAADAGGSTAAATTGTALHAFTERLDTGADLGHVPPEHSADIAAYVRLADQVGWEVLGVEEFVVCDAFRIAGTADRVLRLPDGRVVIGDVKTGSSVAYPHAWAVQTAIYAHSMRYDPETGKRLPWEKVPDQERALVVHVPARQGTATAYWVDIARGWEALLLSMKARTWRQEKNLLTPWEPPAAAPEEPHRDAVLALIETTATVDELIKAWELYAGHGWTEAHTAAAAARRAAIEGGAQNAMLS
ncbi:PD-(D/E)XK nuclease family protein [Georgenia sp. TF02-10]|uniref:PD-(D/E)XK nuclease family protein n=1 Tax=Georgenia sp. TF02-10 TaxID=2917725 RepID=UPI001FA7DF83|nr:PD-(D/E)XK nuclease family protein [Georgenia sp. TF02-10]UNX54112.1 PD-(D/E)XK nuclease family protein [Georgenia sp. TF02-10]